MIVTSFVICLLFITIIGIFSAKKSLQTTADYILADRSIGPLPVALSAVSTCNSGFMFVGMIGYTYMYGLSAVWLVVGWLVGDFFMWNFIYKRLRTKTEAFNTNTVSGFIAHHFSGTKKKIIQKASAFFIVLFLFVYAAAQLTAGSKALTVMLDWPSLTGILVGAVIVTAYSFAGGVRASIWTDVVQSFLMIISMFGLLIVAIYNANGISGLFKHLYRIDPNLLSLFPSNTDYGFPLYLAGWIAFGFGVLGQPHIITRPMTISASSELKKARNYYFAWYIVFALSSIGVGLAARFLIPELLATDPELALPKLAIKLLPSIFVGGILAGLFSATISTADSQILACSAAISQDLLPKWKTNFFFSKLATLATMIVVTIIALFANKSVFILVILAWSGLAVVLGPLILCQCFDIRFGFKTSLLMMIGAFCSVLCWSQLFKLSDHINETLPGLLAAAAIFFTAKLFFSNKKV